MKNIALSSRENKILGLTVCLFLAAVGYHFIYLPVKEKELLSKKEILAAQRAWRTDQQVIRKAKNLEKKYKGPLEEFKQTGSDEQVMSSMLSEISQAASQAQVPVSDMKPSKTRRVDFYNIFSVDLTTEGSLKDVMHFVYLLQTLPHQIQVEGLRLEKTASAKSELRCTLTLSRILIP